MRVRIIKKNSSSFLGFSSFFACGYPCEGEVWRPGGDHQVLVYIKNSLAGQYHSSITIRRDVTARVSFERGAGAPRHEGAFFQFLVYIKAYKFYINRKVKCYDFFFFIFFNL